jgi:UDP-N-acetylmuramate dehydrogenase
MNDLSLQANNTLRLECLASAVARIRDTRALQQACHGRTPEELLILGEGSNVVLAPRIDRTVCLMVNRGIEATVRAGDVLVTAQAGENWHGLVRWTLGQGLFGLENLALIPGSVGAAPVQNIGAYGVELASCFERLVALDLESGEILELDAAACGFGYRTSRFKVEPGRFAITGVTLRLHRSGRIRIDYPDLRAELRRMGLGNVRAIDVAEAVVRIRRRKLPDPRYHANVGSFFKNPVVDADDCRRLRSLVPDLRHFASDNGFKLSAAQLIDVAGWKTRATGPVRVWQRQPLVLINDHTADGHRVLAFAQMIRSDIEQRFAIRLEIEPDLVGFADRSV